MIVTKTHLPRRTVLRGLGATIALPLLDGMVPALVPVRLSAASPARRLSISYVPNGVVMDRWTPAADGNGFALTPILEPLTAHRDRLLVVTGLRNGLPHYVVHGAASTKFLTATPPQASTGTSDVRAGISMDQLAARALGAETQLASLEVSLEGPAAGACDIASSCIYTDTISWRSDSTPLPMEHNPRIAFERLFGERDSTDRASQVARLERQRSLLDSVTEAVSDLQRDLGAGDRRKLGEYLDAVRDVERRIQRAEAQSAQELPAVNRPAGIPPTFPEHARLMYDLQVLALQSDLTRIITFMIGREFSGHTYPEIGVRDAHHPLSHHEHNPQKLATLTKINTHHVEQFAYYLDRLQRTPDGDGSLLDHVTALYGAGMSDGNSHSPDNVPILLAGAGIQGGRHLRFPGDTPLANLHATLLDKLGVHVEMTSSTGVLAGV